MTKDELQHNERYTGIVQPSPQFYTMDCKDMTVGLTKYLRWNAEYNVFSVYNDAEYKDFVTNTFYERFTDIRRVIVTDANYVFESNGIKYEQLSLL